MNGLQTGAGGRSMFDIGSDWGRVGDACLDALRVGGYVGGISGSTGVS